MQIVITEHVVLQHGVLVYHISQNSNSVMSANKREFPTPQYIGDNVYIRPTYFVIKSEYSGLSGKRSLSQKQNERNLSAREHNGFLSSKAKSKMKNAINWLNVSAKYKAVYSKKERKSFWFKVNFITLTIPPQKETQVSSALFQKCLNTFLTYSRKYYSLHNYVWKVELSLDKRLHVHIATDIFYHYKDLRNAWNRILQREGLLAFHFEKFGNYDPNSSDVHKTRGLNDVVAYMCEYMAKDSNLDKDYKGRIWGASYSLSDKHKCECFIESGSNRRNYSFIDRAQIRYKALQGKPDCMGNSKTVANLFMLNTSDWATEMDGLIKEAFNAHRKRIRDNTPTQPKEYLTIDMFGERHILKPDILEPCKIEEITPIIGTMKLDLQF